MLILTIRTDNPTAELGLFDNDVQLAYDKFEGHHQLAESIHRKVEQLLKDQGKTWPDIDGVICFKGPGSFTGLRIGLTVGNALAYSLSVPIVAAEGGDWLESGIIKLLNGENDKIAMPEYGAPVHITPARK